MSDIPFPALLELAVAEIAALRAGAAYEADVLLAHTDYATFPKSRRAVVGAQVKRLHACALGQAVTVTAGLVFTDLTAAMVTAGGRAVLTVASWTTEHAQSRQGGPVTVPAAALPGALDEIWSLRLQFAYEAVVLGAHGDLKSFPASRRRVLGKQVERMRSCARGEVVRAYAGTSTQVLQHHQMPGQGPGGLDVKQWQATRAARS